MSYFIFGMDAAINSYLSREQRICCYVLSGAPSREDLSDFDVSCKSEKADSAGGSALSLALQSDFWQKPSEQTCVICVILIPT